MTKVHAAIKKALDKLVVDKHYKFDRVRIHVYDLSVVPYATTMLERHRRKGWLTDFNVWPALVKGREIPIGFKLDMFQPSYNVLGRLSDLFVNSKVNISYSEFTLALITESLTEANQLRDQLSETLVTTCIGHEPVLSGKDESLYYGHRGCTRVLAMYARRDKVSGEPCLHIELRLSGKSVHRREGIVTLDELIGKDIAAMLSKHVKFYQVGSAVAVEQAYRRIHNMDESVSERALRKSCNRRFNSRQFLAQHLYHDNPEYRDALKRIPVQLFK